jgi:hypothetical protein
MNLIYKLEHLQDLYCLRVINKIEISLTCLTDQLGCDGVTNGSIVFVATFVFV